MIWTEYYPEDNTLLDAERLGAEFQQSLSEINGGLSAQNLPAACITPAALGPLPIFVQYGVCTVEVPVLYDPGVNMWNGGGPSIAMNNNIYQRATDILTFTSPGGMLEVKACLAFWVIKESDNSTYITWIKAKINLDGVTIATTGKVKYVVGNLIPFTTVPITPGAHTLSVEVIISHFTPKTIPAVSYLTRDSFVGYWQGTLSYVNRQR
jgi:hypothetical protein